MTSLRFVDWFAGIGGFRLGLERAGHRCVWSCEIDPFARMVYESRFGSAPEAEDVQRVRAEEIPRAELWTAGFPCQDVSAAGKRGGLEGARSGLVWKLLDLAAVVRPKWILLENVPGLLQFRDGFGELLGRLDDLGYDVAWRVLDAQYFGVPQRRRRVFILAGRAGEASPAGVLLESEGVRGRAESRVATRSRAPEGATRSAASGVEHAPAVASTLTGKCGPDRASGDDEVVVARSSDLLAYSIVPEGGQGGDLRATLAKVSPALTATSESASTDRGLRVIAFSMAQVTHPENRSRCAAGEPSPTLAASGSPACVALGPLGVRRLTPTECERLQGFPDGWTVPTTQGGEPLGKRFRARRYKALGNSVAVPVIRWIGERLTGSDVAQAEALADALAASASPLARARSAL